MQTSLIGKKCHGKAIVHYYVGPSMPDIDVDGEIVGVTSSFHALVLMRGRLYDIWLLAEDTKVEP